MHKTFLLGAIGYPALELLYRRRTHYSMAIAGGCSLVAIRWIQRLPAKILPRALLCSLSVTTIEYLCGLIWNLKFQVWDYRNVPLNWKGQICLPFSFVWFCLSAALLLILDICDRQEALH